MLMTEQQQFVFQYNSSQAVSHEISDFFCTSFLNLDFAEVFRPKSANSRCTLSSIKTFQKGSQFLRLILKNARYGISRYSRNYNAVMSSLKLKDYCLGFTREDGIFLYFTFTHNHRQKQLGRLYNLTVYSISILKKENFSFC